MTFTIITILNVALWVLSIGGYMVWNLLKKNEKLENIINQQQMLIQEISQTIEESAKYLKEIDKRGSFSSDDEIGWFFKGVKEIQSTLNQFIIK